MDVLFEWDLEKEVQNIIKHGFSFDQAREVFSDPKAVHLEDPKHSGPEDRSYVVGRVSNGTVLTVRYTLRGKTIRIFGAANWRKWRRFYERNT